MTGISVLGAMVPEISANDAEGMILDVPAKLVKLTLTAVSKNTGESTLRPASGMHVWSDFEQAVEDAFAWWKKDQKHLVDVVWKMEPYPSGDASKDEQLPELKGPSLGGAFAAALTLLYYRYYREFLVSERPTLEETKFATTVAHIDSLSFAISAIIATPELWAEKIVLGPVGYAKYKAVVDLLVLSDQQSDAPETAIRAHTIEDALNRVLDRHASILVS
jgi:hypothetical protein